MWKFCSWSTAHVVKNIVHKAIVPKSSFSLNDCFNLVIQIAGTPGDKFSKFIQKLILFLQFKSFWANIFVKSFTIQFRNNAIICVTKETVKRSLMTTPEKNQKIDTMWKNSIKKPDPFIPKKLARKDLSQPVRIFHPNEALQGSIFRGCVPPISQHKKFVFCNIYETSVTTGFFRRHVTFFVSWKQTFETAFIFSVWQKTFEFNIFF